VVRSVESISDETEETVDESADDSE
jgi:hypothetical protein